jgi:hypothetical protein
LIAAAIVAIHERIERITPELLPVKRLEPARVLEAKRAATIAIVVDAEFRHSQWRSLERLADAADSPAREAVARVLASWRTDDDRSARVTIPVLCEMRHHPA